MEGKSTQHTAWGKGKKKLSYLKMLKHTMIIIKYMNQVIAAEWEKTPCSRWPWDAPMTPSTQNINIIIPHNLAWVLIPPLIIGLQYAYGGNPLRSPRGLKTWRSMEYVRHIRVCGNTRYVWKIHLQQKSPIITLTHILEENIYIY